ncbi:MAG TPA: hypothetical protein VLL08_16710 [Kineosporiaceae bacterium]|nr:hypothetical protein [Kineosporiaceae bacterium]
MGVQLVPAPGAFAVSGHGCGGGVLLGGDDRRVGGLGREYPVGDRVDLAALFRGAPVPDHVPGVLRVVQDLPDRGTAPPPESAGGIGGVRRRVERQVGVEPFGDHPIREALADPHLVDPLHGRRPGRVGDQAGLVLAFGSASGHRMRDAVGDVPIRGLTDVPALLGVDLEAAPGLFEHVQDVPLGDALFHPPGQDVRGPAAGHRDALIGGEQQDSGLLEFVFDLRAVVGESGDPVHGFADHDVEAAVGAFGLGE